MVVKIPSWQFEKFPGAEPVLGTQMKSVGEVMAIGRTFKQALCKGIRSPGNRQVFGTREVRRDADPAAADHAHSGPARATSASRSSSGYTVEQIHEMTAIDPGSWSRCSEMVELEAKPATAARWSRSRATSCCKAKRYGISDIAARRALGRRRRSTCATRRKELGVARRLQPRGYLRRGVRELHAVSLFELRIGVRGRARRDRKKVMILGSGPNRIGQGIEFDYCCCHASFALQEFGVESIMVNCNPETVSTDYDTSDRLYFEPLTLEEVLNIVDTEKPDGVIVQFGGQTPLNLALPLKRLGVPIIGTDPENIDLAEDRKLFGKLLDELEIPSPAERHCDQRARKRCDGRAAARLSRCWCGPATCSAAARW